MVDFIDQLFSVIIMAEGDFFLKIICYNYTWLIYRREHMALCYDLQYSHKVQICEITYLNFVRVL